MHMPRGSAGRYLPSLAHMCGELNLAGRSTAHKLALAVIHAARTAARPPPAYQRGAAWRVLDGANSGSVHGPAKAAKRRIAADGQVKPQSGNGLPQACDDIYVQ